MICDAVYLHYTLRPLEWTTLTSLKINLHRLELDFYISFEGVPFVLKDLDVLFISKSKSFYNGNENYVEPKPL